MNEEERKAKNREWQRAKRAAMSDEARERDKATKRAYYQRTKPEHKERRKRYSIANADKIKTSKQAYRKQHKDDFAERTLRFRQGIKSFINDIKLHYGCMNPNCCVPFADLPPCCFDFHHLHDKSFSISHGVRHGWDELIPEINKCTVLCAICHRLVTWEALDDSTFPACSLDGEGNIIERVLL